MLADLLTGALSRSKHWRFVSLKIAKGKKCSYILLVDLREQNIIKEVNKLYKTLEVFLKSIFLPLVIISTYRTNFGIAGLY